MIHPGRSEINRRCPPVLLIPGQIHCTDFPLIGLGFRKVVKLENKIVVKCTLAMVHGGIPRNLNYDEDLK